MPGQFEVMIERNFSSAHQLRGYRGKCENLHGHNYKIEIYARGRELDNVGLLVDFVELKAAADDVVTYLDHRNINELPPFDDAFCSWPIHWPVQFSFLASASVQALLDWFTSPLLVPMARKLTGEFQFFCFVSGAE